MPANQATEGTLVSAGLLVGRLLLALIFMHEGWSIIGGYSGAAAYMQKFGVPGVLLPAVLFHWQFADSNQLLHFEKDLAIAGGFLVLAVNGTGEWSLDRRIRRSLRPA